LDDGVVVFLGLFCFDIVAKRTNLSISACMSKGLRLFLW
jgi:hypothetical protein